MISFIMVAPVITPCVHLVAANALAGVRQSVTTVLLSHVSV